MLTIRDQPPEGLRRTPGPKALLYYLPRDEELAASRLRLPTSTRTIWRLLRQHGRILPRCPRQREPLERPAPLVAWQLDFKDASSVPAEPQGKRQHVVEVLDVVDTGTSLLLEALPRADFTAETALASLAAASGAWGCRTRSPWIAIPAWSVPRRAAISPRRCCASAGAWMSR